MSKSKLSPARQNVLNLFNGFNAISIDDLQKKHVEKHGEKFDGKILTWLREQGFVLADERHDYRKRTPQEIQEYLTANL